jgi:ABC-2 type transport system ATP-binding protein
VSDHAVETVGLGKRFGRSWALHDCTITVPSGTVCGLVGANGAGKTTLLRLLAGLSRASAGTATVTGLAPADDTTFLERVGYLAQEIPLYRRWTAADHLAMGRHLNPVWDEGFAADRLQRLGIPLDRPVAALSGGMRAQVALALALGKRPEVLLLDEPVAALDPLARHEFLASLVGAVAEGGVTVVLSSHLLPDLERVCDHLVLISDGSPMLSTGIEELVARHKVLRSATDDAPAVPAGARVLARTRTPREQMVTVEIEGPVLDPRWDVSDLGLEEIVLTYLGHHADLLREVTDPVEVVP